MARTKSYDFFGKFTYFVPSVAEMFILLAFLIAGVLLGNLVSLVALLIPDAGTSVSMLLAYPVMFIPAMLYASFQSNRRKYNSSGVLVDNGNFSPAGGVTCAILAVAATLCVSFCSDIFSKLLPEPSETFKQLMKSVTEGNIILNFISVSLFAPLFEEWLCRGMILRGLLAHNVRPVWAIVISAAFFALIHLNPWQALPAFTVGAMMGYVYYRTGSLKLTMLMHFSNNTLALILANTDSLKDIESWTDIMPAGTYWLLFACGILLLALCILRFSRIQCGAAGALRKVPSLFESGMNP